MFCLCYLQGFLWFPLLHLGLSALWVYFCIRCEGMFFLKKYLFLKFIWMHQILVVALRIFDLHCSIQTVSCGKRDLVPWPRIEPRPPSWEQESGPLDHQRCPWECSNLIALQVVVQFSQHHLLKKMSFLHCIFFCFLHHIYSCLL